MDLTLEIKLNKKNLKLSKYMDYLIYQLCRILSNIHEDIKDYLLKFI